MTTIDWSKPIVGILGGQKYPIKYFNKSTLREGKSLGDTTEQAYTVTFETPPRHPEGCMTGFRYDANGFHVKFANEMPVIVNEEAIPADLTINSVVETLQQNPDAAIFAVEVFVNGSWEVMPDMTGNTTHSLADAKIILDRYPTKSRRLVMEVDFHEPV